MATVDHWVAAPPADVWAILADPRSYAQWVVGSHSIDGVAGPWPEVGATFTHTQGQGPFKLTDTTTVQAVEPGRRLLLEVRIRPFLTGPVDVTLESERGGTRIRIDERVGGGLARAVPRLATSPLIAVRNAHALRRLAAMAWARAATLDHAPADAWPSAAPEPVSARPSASPEHAAAPTRRPTRRTSA